MNKYIRVLLVVSLVLAGVNCFAQEKVAMADTMRSNGKIYVVVAVCLTILFGLIGYVFYLDKKITRIEKHLS